MQESKKGKHAPNPKWTAIAHTAATDRYEEVYTEMSPNELISWELDSPNSFVAESKNGLRMKINLMNDRMWRVRYASADFEPDFSYAIANTFHKANNSFQVEEHADHLVLKGTSIHCRISKTDFQLTYISKGSAKTILKEAKPYTERSTILEGKNQVKIAFESRHEESYLGLGDKSWNLNLRGKSFENWNSDAFAFGKDKDPLYRTIPFYYGLHESSAYGIFLHNTSKSHFDFNSLNDGINRVWAESGEMDYFFFYGPKLIEVAESYHALTGVPELPPLWALGFHQCRWSYYPESRVRELANTFRDLKIPCDAIYLDIDYMDGYRCFTWNKNYFPKPGEMIRDLEKQGFQTIVMIDPGIKVDKDYAVYQTGKEEDIFCKRSSGQTMKGPVWPPICVWPDFTMPKAREWWGKLYEDLYVNDHVSGFWNDMNEPAVFKVDHMTFPDDVLHNYDGHQTNHKKAHNIYGQQMARATYKGLKSIKPEKRPFVLTRATFSGGQRHAAVWTGDNIASWEHLRLANRQCQRLSISGFSLVGTDIGGFVNHPSPELLIRWIQLGVFHPVFRVHSMGNNADGAAETNQDEVQKLEESNRLDQEPWAFGEPYTSQARKAIEFRYRLLPYLYTAMYRHTFTGQPFLRSLVFEDQSDQRCLENENQFLIGNHLLINPVTQEGARQVETYLPQGDWLDFYTGDRQTGRKTITQTVDVNSIPIQVRAGAIIPFYPVQQYTSELEIETIELRAYYKNGHQSSHLYLDDGDGYGYEKEAFLYFDLYTFGQSNSFKITSNRKGTFESTAAVFEIKFFGLPSRPTKLLIDNIPVEIIDFEGDIAVVMAPLDFELVEVIW